MRSDEYRRGYANGFASGRRHRAVELATWRAVFDQNERLKAVGRALVAENVGAGGTRAKAAEELRKEIDP